MQNLCSSSGQLQHALLDCRHNVLPVGVHPCHALGVAASPAGQAVNAILASKSPAAWHSKNNTSECMAQISDSHEKASTVNASSPARALQHGTENTKQLIASQMAGTEKSSVQHLAVLCNRSAAISSQQNRYHAMLAFKHRAPYANTLTLKHQLSGRTFQ
jgi:hypothetical protein